MYIHAPNCTQIFNLTHCTWFEIFKNFGRGQVIEETFIVEMRTWSSKLVIFRYLRTYLWLQKKNVWIYIILLNLKIYFIHLDIQVSSFTRLLWSGVWVLCVLFTFCTFRCSVYLPEIFTQVFFTHIEFLNLLFILHIF